MVQIRRDIGAYGDAKPNKDGENYQDGLTLDVLIVGAGFGGVYLLHRLRDEMGYKVKIFEAGTNLGGVWYWNRYSGARVDTPVPIYEYSFPKVWKTWNWSEKYPGHAELRRYFDHVDKTLDIKKDVAFNTKVVSAQYNKETKMWDFETEDGRKAHARFFINAVGFAAKRHFPDWKGLDSFKGEMYHSSFWPENGIDSKGKRVAVIGTGSTGIQIAQETSKDAASVTVFQRTPNLCLPMRQRNLTVEEQEANKENYPEIYRQRKLTFAGFPFDFSDTKTFEHSPEEREAFYQSLWDEGGFHYWLATYADMLKDEKANDEAYNFWARKTRERISDPEKRDLLAPLKKPHHWGTKRPSLEQDFYERMDDPKNFVVNIKTNPVVEVTETGIVTQDGVHREFDLIALATGYDAVTGGMKNMGIKDENGTSLSDKWEGGPSTFLGMTCAGYPNLFFLYGAQGPTAFSNGPTCVEVQGDWIAECIEKCKKEGITYIKPTEEAEQRWKDLVKSEDDQTLFPLTDSWYNGANILGKTRAPLNFIGGFPLYNKEIRNVLDNDFQGFVTVKG